MIMGQETICNEDCEDSFQRGWKNLYQGFSSWFLNMSFYGMAMIVTYELTRLLFLSDYWRLLCLKKEGSWMSKV